MAHCRELLDICKGRKIYIQTHNFPDPDAISSAYGLQKLMQHFGIESVLCYEGRIDKLSTRRMTELFGIEIFDYDTIREEMTEDDYIICVDSQKGGSNLADFIGNEIACIDHHPTYVEVPYLYKDVRIVGACATLIASYFAQLSITPDTFTATSLLYGMKIDTRQFSRGVTDLDIEMFSFLFPLANDVLLRKLETCALEYGDLKAYSVAIENMCVRENVGFVDIPFSCPDALVGILSDFIMQLDGLEFTVVYSKREDGIKFSMRSEDPDVDAGLVMRRMMKGIGTGGGHQAMAGGMIRQEQAEKIGSALHELVQERVMQVVNEAKKTVHEAER